MHICTISCLLLAFILLYLLFPLNASAYSNNTTHTTASGPTLQVTAGFNTRFRDGNWIPVQINLSNNGPDFEGTITINTPSPFGGPITSNGTIYQQPISLPNGTQKHVTISIPINLGGQGTNQDIRVNLLDSNGNVVSTQRQRISAVGQNDVFVALLSDLNTGFSQLYGIPLPNQGGSMIVEALNASTLPDKAAILKNFDLIILDNFTTSNLSADQLTALQSWVNQGGALIEAGGPEWQRTLAALPASLLPVTINGTSTLPAGSPLLPVVSSSQSSPVRINATVPISVGTLAQSNAVQNTTLLTSGTTPLIVQAHLGQGIVCYLAFDPALDPIATWSQTGTLWRELVVRTVGDKMFNSSNFSFTGSTLKASGLGGLLQGLLANNLPSPWLLLALLLGYLIILGPVRFLIIRWRKRRDWSWRIVLASIVLFSLLSYGLAVQQKGTAVLSNSVSIIQLNQSGTSAHISTFVGVFVPNQGNYQVHIPASGLVQQSYDSNDPNNPSGQNVTIQAGQNSTDVNLQGVKIWTLRSLVSENDRQMQGGIVSHLAYQNARLTGTITNTLGYALSDVYILLSTGYLSIGNLAAGQTMPVNLALQAITTNNGATIADQIAQSNKLPTPYGDYVRNGNTPQNETQRHLAILSALSGNTGGIAYATCGGGPCTVPAPGMIAKTGRVFFSGGGPGYMTTSGSDPLLINGAQATLIGWANQHDNTQNVTINGSTPAGLQETLIQAPLNLQLSGTLNLPPSFIPGQIVDVQGTNVQNQYGGTYTMTTGSITFEFTVPGGNTLHLNSLTISEPANLTQNGGPIQSGSGTVVDANHFHISLYNWQTGKWDAFQMSGFTFSTSKVAAYLGPGGRILVQFANQDSGSDTVFFTKPSLNLQGTAS
jgi:hypothetical protein